MEQETQQQNAGTKLLRRREKDRLRKAALRAREKEEHAATKESAVERWQRLNAHLQSEMPELYNELVTEHQTVADLTCEAEMLQDVLRDSTIFPEITADVLRVMLERNFADLLESAKVRGLRRFSWKQLESDAPPPRLSIREVLHAPPGKILGSDDTYRDVDRDREYSRASQSYRLFGFMTQPEETALVASANALIAYSANHEVDPALLEQARRHTLFTPQYRTIRQDFPISQENP